MLRRIKQLQDCTLGARDGEIGKVQEFYFDDDHWTVRYLVADSGNWLEDRKVLISPHALDSAKMAEKVIPVDLTKKQIENSPPLSSANPVSRQYEQEFYDYYDYPTYWAGPYVWGTTPFPTLGAVPQGPLSPDAPREPVDPHLRSSEEVTGYNLHATNGEIGHVEDFVIDDKTWTIRYLLVSTQNWLPGKKVLISPDQIERVSWADSQVFLKMSREQVQHSPEFSDDLTLNEKT